MYMIMLTVVSLCVILSLCTVSLSTSKVPFTKESLLFLADVYFGKVYELQVPKSQHAFPPFKWDKEKGMWPSDVKLNFHGKPTFSAFREIFEIFDNNMFATSNIMACLIETDKYVHNVTWYNSLVHSQVLKGIEVIANHHDLNVNYSNSLMTFWPQKFNDDTRVFNSYPVNLEDLIKLTHYIPLNATYEFLEKLGLKDVETIVKILMSIRKGYSSAFHVPPDFDDTFLNIGLGSVLSERSTSFTESHKLWNRHNTNLSSVFAGLKKYAYRPFSGDQRVNTIDPRSYYYLRKWLEQEHTAGRDVALVPTWVQDTDEVRSWFDKGVMMPFNINNVDVTVCANFLFGVTSGVINGVFPPSLLDDPDIMQIYSDTSRMISFQVETNFSERDDLALTYYPSVMEFYWFVARTYNIMEETIQTKGSLPHKSMQAVYSSFKHVLRKYASPRILDKGKAMNGSHWIGTYWDDFLGDADFDYNNKTENNAEDRTFTTSMAVNALLTIWTTSDAGTHKLVWSKDTPLEVKDTAARGMTWMFELSLGAGFAPSNALFSGSYKGNTTLPLSYPLNRLELFNRTNITRKEAKHVAGFKFIGGVEGFIPEVHYQELMKEIHTPTVFDGYNTDAFFFPYWASEAYTYVICLLTSVKYYSTM